MKTSFRYTFLRLLFPKSSDQLGPVLALTAACCLSFMLVVVSGALIGFMQYQSRLLNAAGISSGDIILQAELDSNMRIERASLEKLREAKEASEADYTEKIREVQFRINNVCGSLNLESADKYNLCYEFMRTIPFNDNEMAGRSQKVMSYTSVSRANVTLIAGMNNDNFPSASSGNIQFDAESVFNSIFDNLTMNDTQKRILQLHKHELLPIARLNIDIQLKYVPRFSKAATELVSKCRRILFLRNNMINYRSFATEACEFIWKQDVASYIQPAPNPATPDHKSTSPTPAVVSATPDSGSAAKTADAAADTSTPDQKSVAPIAAGTAADPSKLPLIYTGGIPQGNSSTEIKTSDEISAIRQRNFELVSQYLFYNTLSFGILQNILISPPDFIAFVLVALCGILGGLLKIILTVSQTGKSPTLRGLIIVMLLGMICALIVYSLFRGGYLVVSNADPKDAATNLNPFVIALLALASGLLSDRAISAFKEWTNMYFGDNTDDPVERWGFALKKSIDDCALSKDEIARLLGISLEKLQEWMEERDSVPYEAQELLSVILRIPRRLLFTQDPPAVQRE